MYICSIIFIILILIICYWRDYIVKDYVLYMVKWNII